MISPFQELQNDPQFKIFLADIIRTELRIQFKNLSEQPSNIQVDQEGKIDTQSMQAPPKVIEPTLRDKLPDLFGVIDLLNNDEVLQKRFLRNSLAQNEEQQIEQVLTIASHWERIEILWDILKERVIKSQQPLLATEQRVLEYVLSCHNRLWVNREASFIGVSEGEEYNYEKHFAVGLGDRVNTQLLPGLLNTAGKLSRKPVVTLCRY